MFKLRQMARWAVYVTHEKIRKFILTKEAHVQFMSDKNQKIFTYVPLPEKRKSCSSQNTYQQIGIITGQQVSMNSAQRKLRGVNAYIRAHEIQYFEFCPLDFALCLH